MCDRKVQKQDALGVSGQGLVSVEIGGRGTGGRGLVKSAIGRGKDLLFLEPDIVMSRVGEGAAARWHLAFGIEGW